MHETQCLSYDHPMKCLFERVLHARFELLTARIMKITALWDLILFRLIDRYDLDGGRAGLGGVDWI
jgi:hypothetical protein